ncbi:hypothetical protein Smp_169550 [Schistosoma mansoni]|uniref:hypothetical protein n=1 Tax=Schistosoma mansoni TaxID=6183 RepID=UPI0001A62783|nr:hypothetical protein Smp_169550 [Schistosoma mansoni]|eukprot:XP_018647394.1 hypothetical protein Smp_169550 [Schistosoma mansoni]
MNSWRREWLKKSSKLGRRRILNAANFLAAQMLPWWLKCNKCGLWRQLPPQTTVGSSKCNYRPDKFTCADVVKFSNNPCSWPVDERAKIVINKPHDFLASMQTHAWLQASPALKVSSSYGVDLAGLSPDPLPGSTDEDEKAVSSDSPFSVFEEDGAFSPIDLHAWERFSFSEMSRFPTLYLAVRNLVLCLWFRNPKRLITGKFAANHCFVRGLLRIVLCEHWIPHLIEEFTCRGLINVGVCQIDPFDLAVESDQIVTGVSKEQKQQQIPSKFQLRIIGDSDLTTAVTIRQLWNALYLHQLHVQSSQRVQSQQQKLYFPLSIKLIPSPSVVSILSTFTNSLNNNSLSNNKLAELMIQFSSLNNTIQSTVELITNKGFDKNMCDNNNGDMKNLKSNALMLKKSKQCPILSVPSLMSPVQIDENKNLSGIFVPLHSWSDRIYTYSHHPVSIFAWQTGLELHPIAKCLLLQPSSNKTNAEINPKLEEMEGVDFVTDINKNDNNTVLKSITHRLLDRTSSVEDCWDEMDAEVRRRLTDLTGNSIEQSLIEYFLASVEYDLTEPLTTNFTELSKSSSMRYLQPLTARLDQLPVCYFNEKTVTSTTVTREFSQQQSNNLNGNNENLTAYVIRTPSSIRNCANESNSCLIPGPINYLWNCLTKNIINESITCDNNGLSQLISIILENYDFNVNTSSSSLSSSDDNIIDANSSMHIVSTPLKQCNCSDNSNNNYTKEKVISDDLKSIRLNYTNGTELVDWVIVTTPIDRIRLHFVPKSLVSNDMLNRSVQYSKQTYLSIYLPFHLRSILIDEHYLLKNEPYALDVNRSVDKNIGQYSTNARLITITLVYSSSWWRQYTTEGFVSSDPSHTVSFYGDNFSELFSFLPDSRENRGFCHVFRDLRPDINSPGILQTQLFAASADHWWDKTDVLLQTAVDRYLKTHFMISSSTEESQFSDRFNLLSSYIARLQTPNLNSSKNCICIVNNEENDCREQWFHVKRSAWMELVKRTGLLIVNLIQNENYIDYGSRKENCLHINNHINGLTTSEMIYTSNPLHYSGMDAVTSSVQAGLELANLTLRLLPHRNQFHSKFSSLVSTNETVISVDDQSNDTCDPNSNESFNSSHSHQSLDNAKLVQSSWERVQNLNCQFPETYFNNNTECLSARTRRLLKRKHSESDQNLVCLE